jgi:hypothetical protein
MLSSRTGRPAAERKARALFAFSTAKSRKPRSVSSAGAGSAPAAVPPSGVGIA